MLSVVIVSHVVNDGVHRGKFCFMILIVSFSTLLLFYFLELLFTFSSQNYFLLFTFSLPMSYS